MAKIPINNVFRKHWVKPVLIVAAVVVLLLLLLAAMLSTSRVQTWIVSRMTHRLSGELKAHIFIREVHVSGLHNARIEGIYISDRHYDTLLYIPEISIGIREFSWRENQVVFDKIKLEKPVIRIRRHLQDSLFNYAFLVDYFSGERKDTAGPAPWILGAGGVEIRQARLDYLDDRKPLSVDGIDFNHMMLGRLNADILNLFLIRDTVTARINQLSFLEKSGFSLQRMKARMMLTKQEVSLKDMILGTGFSTIETDLRFSFDDAGSFSHFTEEVRINAYFLPSEINMRDIAYFAPALRGMNNPLTLSGEVSGLVSNLKLKDFHVEYGNFTRFSGNIRLDGLPKLEETFIQLNIKRLKTNHYDLNTFLLPGGVALAVPDQITKLGNISIQGTFTGFYTDFVSYAGFQTGIGSLYTDLALKTRTASGQVEYSGKLRTREFNLGSLLGLQKYFGKVNMNAELTGSGLDPSGMMLNLDGVIDSLYFKGNNFREIRLSGGIYEKVISGSVLVDDHRLNLEFDGSVDVGGKIPVFDFVSNIRNANLNALNLVRSDSVMRLATRISARFEGLDPEYVTGSVLLDSSTLKINTRPYAMNRMEVSVARVDSMRKEIKFRSDYADADLSGSFRYTGLLPAVRDYLGHYLPALFPPAGAEQPGTHKPEFTLDVSLKDLGRLAGTGLPAVFPAPGTHVNLRFDGPQESLTVHAESDSIRWGGQQLKSWYLTGLPGKDRYLLETGCRHFLFDEDKGVDSLRIVAENKSDTVDFSLNWDNENPLVRNHGDIDGLLSFLGPSQFRLQLIQSRTVINDSVWTIPQTNLIEVDSQAVRISDLRFVSGDESISLNGVLSEHPDDALQLDFNGFDLSNMDVLTRVQGFDFDGEVTGNVKLRNLGDAPDITSDIIVHDFTVNRDKLGNALIWTRWDPALKALEARTEVIYRGNVGENRPVIASGYYYPARPENSLDFSVHIEQFKLKTISHLLSSFSSRFTGLAAGDLKITGSLKHPDLEGKVRINRGLLKVDYLNTTYYFSDEVRISRRGFHLDRITAFDTLGNKAVVDGQITHDRFRDFRIDLNIKPEKLMALNTTSRENRLFYGDAYATGNVNITGPSDNLKLDIVARTEKGTQLTLPISTTMDVSDQDFISFTTGMTDTMLRTPTVKEFKGVTLNLNLDATPEASIRIFLPSDMGTIRASGKGDLKLLVDTRGQFNITGDYEISDGSFSFTLQNVIYRMFRIQPGGKIMFSGDPYAAQVNLRAVHSLDVPLTGLRIDPEQLQSISKKIPVDCIIDMKGSLFNPELAFKIATPEKDPEINRILFSQLDTNNQQQMSEQLIFLMVLKQFKPLERTNPLDLNASVGSSSWDMLSAQLNNWLSHISNDFDIGVNYKPGDRLTNDELTVALSTQLFDERVSIDGNFGYTGGRNPTAQSQQATNLVGDVKVEVKLTDDGRFRVKAYNKSNNVSLFEDNVPYTQGVGIFFRKEFDRFMDLFKARKKKQPAA